MLSVASLLNPVKPESRGTRLPSSPSPSLCTSSSTHGSPLLSTQSSSIKKQKMTKDGAVFAKGKIKGEVNYPPFERLDDEVLREVQKFQVYPLGNIQEYSRHIPYNSEKKTFLEKTSRESFEVFQYVFKVPGDDKEYVVMWDYNIGLVRITPFFKCCKYSKTTPAKMLNMNPGLKEITHSITGGALAAQGYWMPYSCALAVCTTFCSHIAPALIPIFGPSFPSLCVQPEAPEHGRMIIDSSTVHSATAEAEAYRLQYSSSFSPKSASARDSYSPIHMSDSMSLTSMRRTPPSSNANTNTNLGRRMRLKRAFGGESPYGLITDTDFDLHSQSESSSGGDAYFLSPVTPVSANSLLSTHGPQAWRSQAHIQTQNHNQNMHSHSASSSINGSHSPPRNGPNPLLSAIPRSTGLSDLPTWRSAGMGIGMKGKRRAEEVDADDEYDGEESTSGSAVDDKASVGGRNEGKGDRDVEMAMGAGSEDVGGAEKKAAWLLMKLSVKDGERGSEAREREAAVGAGEGPRIKRRRATSM